MRGMLSRSVSMLMVRLVSLHNMPTSVRAEGMPPSLLIHHSECWETTLTLAPLGHGNTGRQKLHISVVLDWLAWSATAVLNLLL